MRVRFPLPHLLSLTCLMILADGKAFGQTKDKPAGTTLEASALLDAPRPVPKHLSEMFDRMEAANGDLRMCSENCRLHR